MNSAVSSVDSSTSATSNTKARDKQLLELAAKYDGSNAWVSVGQILNTFVPFFLLLGAMYWSLQFPYIVTLLIGVLAGLFLVRIFILQHDCGHGSFFNQRWANDLVGYLCSYCTLIPYLYWRRQHAIHHASNGNLDHRGHGDVELRTVREYLTMPWREKIKYYLHRNAFTFLVLGPAFFVVVVNRCAFDRVRCSARERMNVHVTNVIAVLMYAALCYWLGAWTVFKIMAPVVYIASLAGIWMFYVQHQFEHTYWKRDRQWSYVEAALKGSTFYKLPRILQWLSGNIGFHHIHHLRPTIPNYRLEKCHVENPPLQETTTVTLVPSFGAMLLSLWDEEQDRLISFREFRQRYKRAAPQYS